MNTHVVIQTAFIGDVFLSVPFLQKLRELFPQDKIVYVAKKNVGQFLKIYGFIDDLVEVEKGHRQSYKIALDYLAKFKIQNVFCLHRSLRSSLFTLQINANAKFGYDNLINRFLFSQVVGYPKKFPDALRQMSLLTLVSDHFKAQYELTDWSYLNNKNSQNNFEPIPVGYGYNKVVSDSNDNLKSFLNKTESKKNIALFPGSVWETKKWPVEYYIQLAQRLVPHYHVYIMGGPDESNLAHTIKSSVPEVVVLAGRLKLVESIMILNFFDLVICNDSSPSHMATFLNKPVVSIFGPTTLDLGFRPWGDFVKVIENNKLDCRPCGLHGHRQCPLRHHKCMRDIDVNAVLDAAEFFLKSTKLV